MSDIKKSLNGAIFIFICKSWALLEVQVTKQFRSEHSQGNANEVFSQPLRSLSRLLPNNTARPHWSVCLLIPVYTVRYCNRFRTVYTSIYILYIMYGVQNSLAGMPCTNYCRRHLWKEIIGVLANVVYINRSSIFFFLLLKLLFGYEFRKTEIVFVVNAVSRSSIKTASSTR